MRLVRFDLTEVGIDGRVEHETVVNDGLSVHPDGGIRGLGDERRDAARPRVERSKRSRRHVGDRLQVPARGHVLDALDDGRLPEAGGDSRRAGGPVHLLVLARDRAVEEDAPLLRVGRRKAQASKRNLEQDHVAVLGSRRLRAPHCVPRQIPALSLGVGAVGLHAVRVHLEAVRVLQIAERVDLHRNGVFVIRKRVARQHVRADAIDLPVEAEKGDVQVVCVVADVHDRALRDRLAVVWKPLNESFDPAHAERRREDFH